MSEIELKQKQHEIISRLNDLGIEVRKDKASIKKSLNSYVIGRDRRVLSVNISK